MKIKPEANRVFVTVRDATTKERYEATLFLETGETVSMIADTVGKSLLDRFKVKPEFKNKSPKKKDK